MSTPESSISRYLGRFRGAGVATAFFLLAAAAVAAAQFGDTTSNLDLSASASQQALVPAEPPLLPVPRAVCGPGARQETGIQGRISRADHESGLAALGLRCNTQLVGQHTQEKAGQDGTIVGTVGGYKVLRYKDKLGNECAYYDTSLLPPTNAGDGNLGVRVLDMHDPSKPALSMNLTSPAMSFPHESLILSEKRGLLMAVAGNLSQTLLPGQVDIYDLEATPGFGCKVPKLLSSTPLGIWGHESGLAPDGNTFYASSLSNETVTALDISDPVVPRLLVHQSNVAAHGLSLSDDGKTAYVARGQNKNGLEIYDVSSIQNREANPRMVFVSKLTWNQMSVPQSTVPITIGGKPFVIESDEFLRNGTDRTGASRIIDISDPKTPFVISNLRLEVHQEANRINGKLQDDPGTTANGTNTFAFAQDYTGHFCNVPTKVDPPIVACGMSISGLRIFNIEDPYNPREVGYFTAPVQKKVSPEGSNWAYSQPVFAPERKEVWYSEAYTGFYAVKLTNGAWPDAGTSAMTTQATVTVPVGSPISDTATVSGIVTPSGATSTGTIEFSAYGPDDATCTVSAFTSAPIPVNDRRQYKSGEFTPSQAGVYRWIARYSGDSLNAPVSGRCDEANETSTVRKRTPTLATSAMRTASVGQSISDTATVTGVYQTTGATGTGTIRFDLYAPGDTTCATPIFTSGPTTVAGDGTYGSASYPSQAAGAYRWVAAYSGDANNAGSVGRCDDPQEQSTVTTRKPTLSTQATPTAALGAPISDSATVTGLYRAQGGSETGLVRFRLYGPDDTSCTTASFTTDTIVRGDGTYQSQPFAPLRSGTYRWIATYTGDANNDPVAGRCNDANETTLVSAAQAGGDPPVPSSTATPVSSPAPSTRPTASSRAQATPSDSTSASASASSSSLPCSRTLGVRINSPFINATGLASVTATGATPGSPVLLEAYSQVHEGTAYFDHAGRVVRTGTADASGAVSWNDIRPSSNTRVRALQEFCSPPAKDTAQERGGVINVRTALFLKVTRNSSRTYTFSGDSIPARTGGLIVSVYRVVGSTCSAGIEPRDCPGERFVGQSRANSVNGEHAVTLTFGGSFSGREKFVLKTGRDAQNAPGRSNVRDVAIF